MSEKIDTSGLLDELFEVDPEHQKEIDALEKNHRCSISCNIEKHNALQYTYFYEVDFGLEENFFVEIESGINNGTQIKHAEWGVSTERKTKIVEILKDIVLDMSHYEEGSNLHKKAEAVLSANKYKLFEFHRQNDYDNYVSGGNSKMKLDPLLSQLHLEYIYEKQEVGCNFI